MSAQVLSFFPQSAPFRDWSRDELSELYRVENALVQAGVSLETDRGISDEGDPWFVFCRADGDVLVHIARIDGLYGLYSPGLPHRLVGRSFSELTKSFVNQVPISVPLQRGNGARLFVHPAAMLAVIVGTLFIAFDDAHVFAGQALSDGPERSLEAQLQPDASGFKAHLQHAFQQYITSFLDGIRDESTSKFSFYLNVISAVTAFIFGTVLPAAELSPKLELAATTDGIDESSHKPVDQNPIADEKTVLAANALHAGANYSDNLDHSPVIDSADPQQIAQPVTSGIRVDTNAVAPGSMNDVSLSPADLAARAAELFHVAADDRTPLSPKGLSLLASGSEHGGRDAGASVETTVGTAASDTLMALLQGDGLSNSVIDLLMHHAVNSVFQLSTDEQKIVAQVFNDAPSSDNAVVSSASANPSDKASLSQQSDAVIERHFKFDDAGQAALVAFLQANPNAEAVLHGRNVIVYDGDNAPPPGHHQITVQLWELDSSGATIALVGHADAPVPISLI